MCIFEEKLDDITLEKLQDFEFAVIYACFMFKCIFFVVNIIYIA